MVQAGLPLAERPRHRSWKRKEVSDHTRPPIEPGGAIVHVKSYGDVIRDYLVHPEGKAVDSNGSLCGDDTRGLLFPPRVTITGWVPIGKETNALDDRTVGLVDVYEATNVYRDPGDAEDRRLLDAMAKLGVRRIHAAVAEIAERYDTLAGGRPPAPSTIRDILTNRSKGTQEHWRWLTAACRKAMRRWLRGMDLRPQRGELGALTDQFLAEWMRLVEQPSDRYPEAISILDGLPHGGVDRGCREAGVSRQKLRTLHDPESRAAVVRAIESRESAARAGSDEDVNPSPESPYR